MDATTLPFQALTRRALSFRQRNGDLTMRLLLLAWVALIGMPVYFVVWTVWFPQAYENLPLRLLGMSLCLPALFARERFSAHAMQVYLFVGMTYVLPFFFTYMYLMNHASPVWTQSLLVALIVLFHFPTGQAALSYVIGTVLACSAVALMGGLDFVLSSDAWSQLPIHAFAIVVISIAKVSRNVLEQEKLEGMAQGLATVSHELRTPLASVDANARGLQRLGQHEALERIQFEVRHMNQLIELFLLSASALNRKLAPNEKVSMASAIQGVLERYPFCSQAQRELVALEVRRDVVFRGQRELTVVILLNLLRNSLKAIQRAGKGRVRIIIDGRRVLFIDTGCGIATRDLPLVFQRFYTYPAGGGAGIGLALCKEIMQAWQAGIRCISRERAYTILILEFPAHL